MGSRLSRSDLAAPLTALDAPVLASRARHSISSRGGSNVARPQPWLVASLSDVTPRYRGGEKAQRLRDMRQMQPCKKVPRSCSTPTRMPVLTSAEEHRMSRYLGPLIAASPLAPVRVAWPFGGGWAANSTASGHAVDCESVKLLEVAWHGTEKLTGCRQEYTCSLTCYLMVARHILRAEGAATHSQERHPHTPTPDVANHHRRRRKLAFLSSPSGARLLWVEGDPDWTLRLPVLAKARRIDSADRTILLPLNWERHYRDLIRARSFLADAPPFAQRRAAVVWRGATTGNDCDPAHNLRMQFVRRWVNVSNVGGVDLDVGFTKVVQCFTTDDVPIQMRRDVVKPPELLSQYKYLISLEGNDVATNVASLLYADAVPLMPTPIVETWLLHGDLVEWKHYVPLKRDGASDLPQRLRWLENNPKRAAAIARAGREFVVPYGDHARDAQLAGLVLRHYLSAVKIEVTGER